MKHILLVALLMTLISSAPVPAQQRETRESTAMLTNVTTTVSSAAVKPAARMRTFHGYGTTTAGSGNATILIEVSNIETPAGDSDWFTSGTIALTLGTVRTSAGYIMDAPYRNVRARVSVISGTGASVSCRMGS